jgi:hypothetical protein
MKGITQVITAEPHLTTPIPAYLTLTGRDMT